MYWQARKIVSTSQSSMSRCLFVLMHCDHQIFTQNHRLSDTFLSRLRAGDHPLAPCLRRVVIRYQEQGLSCPLSANYPFRDMATGMSLFRTGILTQWTAKFSTSNGSCCLCIQVTAAANCQVKLNYIRSSVTDELIASLAKLTVTKFIPTF